jgi:small nuclear ribonucleoprotein (snRNP)-like protein
MRSFDQYSNIVLENCKERQIMNLDAATTATSDAAKDIIFNDKTLGLYIVRGENIVLMGSTDMKAFNAGEGMRRVDDAEYAGEVAKQKAKLAATDASERYQMERLRREKEFDD